MDFDLTRYSCDFRNPLGPLLQALSRALHPQPSSLPIILAGKLLRPPPELLLQRDVSRALHRRHEPREISLLILDDRNPLVFAERGFARQTQGQNSEAQKDFEHGLKLNNDLRLMLDLHLLDLQMQIKEMERRQSAIKKNIA